MSNNTCQEENIIIRKNRLSRYLRLSVNRRGQIVLSVPIFCSQRRALSFLEENRAWIQERQNDLRPTLKFQNGQTVSVLGRQVMITHQPTGRSGVYIENDRLLVSGEADFIHRRVTDFIKRETLRYIHEKARESADRLGVSFHKIHLNYYVMCTKNKLMSWMMRAMLALVFSLIVSVGYSQTPFKLNGHWLEGQRSVIPTCSVLAYYTNYISFLK